MKKLIVVVLTSLFSWSLLICLLGDQYQHISFQEAEQKLCKKGETLEPANVESFPVSYVCALRVTKRKYRPEKIPLRSLDKICDENGSVMTYSGDTFSCSQEIAPDGRYAFPEAIL